MDLLDGAGVAEPRLNAEVLLAHAIHCERSYFFGHPERQLKEVEWIHYGRYLNDRMKGKPTQYITGNQEFYGRDFRVTPAVLIPRPETEHLVEAVLQALPKAAKILDVGTGSGAIAVTLALEAPGHTVFAADISPQALKVAAANAANLKAPVRFLNADLLNALGDQTLDAVVSNPPYVSSSDAETMQREVRDWEPHLALFAGATGLDIYRRLIPEAARVLKSGGLLALEFGFGQATELAALVSDWSGVEIKPDLAGIARVLLCRKL